MWRITNLLIVAAFVPIAAAANPIELAPGLWQINSNETQDVASDGRINSQAPVTSSDKRCLDEITAWLVPSDYASSFDKPGCEQNSFQSTPLDFKGEWLCQVEGMSLTVNMTGTASLTGDSYTTLMTVNGRNATKSVNVRNEVNATRLGDCPASGYLEEPAEEVLLRGR